MRRKQILAAAAIGLGLLLSGCGKKEKILDPNNPTAIVVWHYYNGKQQTAFDKLVEEFNNTVGAKKGIVVTAESKGAVNSLAEAVLDSAQKKVGAEPLPDVFATYMDTANSIYEMGLLTDIRQYMEKEELAEYVPAFIEEGSLKEGELYVLPVAKSSELLYLNQTDWEKFAKETGHNTDELSTWEGIADVSEDYYEWSGGKAFFGRDAMANYILVGSHQLGSDLYEKTDEGVVMNLDKEVLRRIWDAYAAPYIKGYYGAYGRFRSDDVKTGDLLACVGSTSSVAYFPKEVTLENGTTYPIESVVLPLPNFEGTERVAVQQGAGMAVAKSDVHREAASVEFLKWFTDVEQNMIFCVESGYFPVKLECYEKENSEKTLEAYGLEKTDVVYQNAEIGLQMLDSTALYTTPVTEKGEEYRSILTKYLTGELDILKEQYDSLGDAEKETFLEQAFETWLSGLGDELQG